MVREVLSEILGDEYDELWPYIHYALSETKRAVQNGFKSWAMFFTIGDWNFTCDVLDVFGERVDWWISFYNGHIVIKIEEDRIRVGDVDESGDVRWVRNIPL